MSIWNYHGTLVAAAAALAPFFLPFSAAAGEDPYLVLVDPGKGEEYVPAAEALAALHQGAVRRFEPSRLETAFGEIRRAQPRFVAFVIPPDRIDVDLSHEILSLATKIDDDPFVDFEYGFITGRDGRAARLYVERIAAAWKRRYGKKAAMFGSWEGLVGPQASPFTYFRAMGFEASSAYVRARDAEEKRRGDARRALAGLRGHDALLFFSHGYPDAMASCFRARDLRQWNVDLAPAILVNCACWNGAPGRWYAPGPGGPVDRGVVEAGESVALEILDRGVTGYVAGVDPWHGPLAMQVFTMITDDGMRLGEATKRMFDRLAIEFHPERIQFQQTLKHKRRFSGEGTNNRRYNGGGMIFYGDPALAPFARNARRPLRAELSLEDDGGARIRLEAKSLIAGDPGEDFMLPANRLLNYYSVKSANFMKELQMELYHVLPLPARHGDKPSFRVISALSNGQGIKTGKLQLLIEKTRRGDFLHLRVPLEVPYFPPGIWPRSIAAYGVTIVLEGGL